MEIAKRLTDKTKIYDLGTELGVRKYRIDTLFRNNPGDITSVSREVLDLWLQRQECRTKAYTVLGNALVKCELNMIAHEVLHNPPRDTQKPRSADSQQNNVIALGIGVIVAIGVGIVLRVLD